MAEPNDEILQNVRNWSCNHVFMNVSLLPYNGTPNAINLGLNATSPGYKEKLVDFIDKAEAMNIKVYAVPAFENYWILPEYQNRALQKLDHLIYYQKHVADQFPGKKCHFHGVVTNIEPWAITVSSCSICNQYGMHWEPDMCDGSKRQNNNVVVQHYLNLIPILWSELNNGSFFTPSGTSQNLEGLYMGTVHWNWHYFSQWHKANTNYFPNGNFSLFTGIRNGQHYFDILLPETYCSEGGDSCNSSYPCVSNSVTTVCINFNSQNYGESTGRCWQWFRKHYVDPDFYASHPNMTWPIVMPVDAAPMLYGHAAHMYGDLCNLNLVRSLSKDYTVFCKSKPNYKGSFIYEYHKVLSLTQNLCYAQVNCNQPPTDDADYSMLMDGHEEVQPLPGLTVYPNPADNMLYIEGLEPGMKVRISDPYLQLRIETPQSQLSTECLEEGMYIIQVLNSQNQLIYTHKIFIKH